MSGVKPTEVWAQLAAGLANRSAPGGEEAEPARAQRHDEEQTGGGRGADRGECARQDERPEHPAERRRPGR